MQLKSAPLCASVAHYGRTKGYPRASVAPPHEHAQSDFDELCEGVLPPVLNRGLQFYCGLGTADSPVGQSGDEQKPATGEQPSAQELGLPVLPYYEETSTLVQ